MNNITILGRFTDNPEIKYGQDGKMIVNFTLADNHGQDKVSFFRCSAFGKTAELISQSCKKGHRLLVTGRMEEYKYTDQQTQQQRSLWSVVVNGMNYIEAPNNNQPNNQPRQGQYGAPPQGYGQPPQQYGQHPQGQYPPPANGAVYPFPNQGQPANGYQAPPQGQPNNGYQAPPQGQQRAVPF